MKKIILIMLTVFLNVGLYSCTPTNNVDDDITPQACCGDDDEILPPPPPPPTEGNGGQKVPKKLVSIF